MGLMIHSLVKLPDFIEKDYFVYLLDYGFKDPVSEELGKHFSELSDWAGKNNSVVLRGTAPHFNDEVFSWHSINDISGEEILPAIMVTTINPHYFHMLSPRSAKSTWEENDKILLLPLKEYINGVEDVYPLLRKLLKDLSSGKKLTEFSLAPQKKDSLKQKIKNCLILQPNIHGLGVDLTKVWQ